MDLKIIALARNWFRGRKNVLFDQTTKEIIYFELIFALLYSCLKYPFFQKSAALFPQLQQAQALNGKIENNFLTLLVENYCQGMGQVSPLQDSCWSIALFT